MRIRILACVLLLSCCLTACGSTAPLVNSNEKPASGNTENSAKVETTQVPFFHCVAGLNQKADDGSLVAFSSDNLQVQDGKLNLFFHYRNELDEGSAYDPIHDKMNVIVLMTVNGELCDFTIDDKKSENGIMEMQFQMESEYIAPIQIQNFSVKEGENQIRCHTILDIEEKPLPTPLFLGAEGNFYSDRDISAEKPVNVAVNANPDSLDAETVQKISGKKPISTGGQFTSLFYPYDEEEVNDKETIQKVNITSDTPLYVELPNTEAFGGPANCSGVFIMQKDGALCPAWDGKPILLVQMHDSDPFVSVSANPDFQSGETTEIRLYYVEISSDRANKGASSRPRGYAMKETFVVKD